MDKIIYNYFKIASKMSRLKKLLPLNDSYIQDELPGEILVQNKKKDIKKIFEPKSSLNSKKMKSKFTFF